MEQAGYSCELPEKALIFVKPEQYETTKRALLNEEVHPFHIIVTESVEYLVDEALAEIPCRRRPRQKQGSKRELNLTECAPAADQEAHDGDQDESQEQHYITCVKRTFLCIAPQPRNASSVIQS